MTECKVKLTGHPITPELQQVFGHYGKVQGLVVVRGAIEVQYESGELVRFTGEVLN